MSGDPIARLSKIVRHDLEEIPVLGTPGILFSQELANLFRKFTTVPQHSSKSTWVTSGYGLNVHSVVFLRKSSRWHSTGQSDQREV